MEEPRAFTSEEVRTQFLKYLRDIGEYWAERGDSRSAEEICDGVIFSVLNVFDGTTLDLPGMDIVLRPHPGDKEFLRATGENWYEDGMAVNDFEGLLHEIYHEVD